MKLFLKISNLCNHNTSTLRTDRQTDRQTERQTTCDRNTALCVASRGKNCVLEAVMLSPRPKWPRGQNFGLGLGLEVLASFNITASKLEVWSAGWKCFVLFIVLEHYHGQQPQHVRCLGGRYLGKPEMQKCTRSFWFVYKQVATKNNLLCVNL